MPTFLPRKYTPGYEEMQYFGQDEDTNPNDADDLATPTVDPVAQMEKKRSLTVDDNPDNPYGPSDSGYTGGVNPEGGSMYRYAPISPEKRALAPVDAPMSARYHEQLDINNQRVQSRKPASIGRVLLGSLATAFAGPAVGERIAYGDQLAQDRAGNQMAANLAKAAADEQTKIKDALQQQNQEYVNRYHEGLIKESGERTRTMAENRAADRIGREMIASDKSNIEAKRRATGTYGEGLTEEQAFGRLGGMGGVPEKPIGADFANREINPGTGEESRVGSSVPGGPGEMAAFMRAESRVRKPWVDEYKESSINPTTGEKTFETRYATKQVEIPIGLEGRFRPGTERVPYSELKTALGLQGQANQADIAASHDETRMMIADADRVIRAEAVAQRGKRTEADIALGIERVQSVRDAIDQKLAAEGSKNIFASPAQKQETSQLLQELAEKRRQADQQLENLRRLHGARAAGIPELPARIAPRTPASGEMRTPGGAIIRMR